jgi:uncharacterized protein (DUF427 family)
LNLTVNNSIQLALALAAWRRSVSTGSGPVSIVASQLTPTSEWAELGGQPEFTQASKSPALKQLPECSRRSNSENCLDPITDVRYLATRRESNSAKGNIMSRKCVRIKHAGTNSLIADGRLGWAITPFEGNYYIRKKNLVTDGFRVNYLPGLCVYKFLYVWLDFVAPDGTVSKNLGWKYWLPNPLFPFIWFRVAVPAADPELVVEEYECAG